MINCSILIRDEKCTCGRGERNFRIISVRPHPELASFAGCGREENGGRIVRLSGCSRLNAQYNVSDCELVAL